MDEIITELGGIERRCAEKAAIFETPPVSDRLRAMVEAARQLAASHSGSWLGYHARVYYGDFEPCPPTANFNAEWGLIDAPYSSTTEGDWRRRSNAEVFDELVRRAGNPDLGEFNNLTADAASLFDDCKRELLATFDAVLAEKPDETIEQLRGEAAGLASHISDEDLIRREAPTRAVSSDHEALFAGIHRPPHVSFEAKAQSIGSHGRALRTLAKTARQARLYFEKRIRLKVPTAPEAEVMVGNGRPKAEGTVFVGHGRSDAWKDLRDLLRDRLHLRPDEFNHEPAAGMTTKERLEEMLQSSVFAFVVMTAEDDHGDAQMHARENVVHEAGLFQGHLGFRRAIVLLEEGCAEFSNIVGLVQIRFPKGNVLAKSEEIRRVLEREGLLPK